MLIPELLLSCLVLWASYRAIQPSAHPAIVVLATGGVIAVGVLSFLLSLPAGVIQAVLLVLAIAVWRLRRWAPDGFVPTAVMSIGLAYVVSFVLVWQELEELRQRYPYVSMEDRLPEPKDHLRGEAVTGAAALLLSEWDEKRSGMDEVQFLRFLYLDELHTGMVAVFVKRAGFGLARMPVMSERGLRVGLRTEPPPQQPAAAWSTERVPTPGTFQDEPTRDVAYQESHRLAVFGFANPRGFGLQDDNRRVVGFQSHGFSASPPPPRMLTLRKLDLIGLVLHDEPTAYVSDRLPGMEELADAPTRPLDEFESEGLKVLQGGEDLYVRKAPELVRLLGSVRSGKQCVSCHGGRRGDLLGVFSYHFE